MIPEKLEACPECGKSGENWHYDFQTCRACGYSRMLRRKTLAEPGRRDAPTAYNPLMDYADYPDTDI